MCRASLEQWLVGVDSTVSPRPGSEALADYEAAIAVDSGSSTHDPYGHGSHVASVIAGRGFYQQVDSTGVAPGASLFDVRVFNTEGSGSVSDVIEGLQWVIFRAREHNIRVVNLSVAAASTDRWQTDPLCAAVRRATAAGLVVVAAGNFGKADDGQPVYSTISAPGNDLSVISVGSVNSKGTQLRFDDLINAFSSRGPTCGTRLEGGRQVRDNLLKPDPVAPGNRVFAATATRRWCRPWAALSATPRP